MAQGPSRGSSSSLTKDEISEAVAGALTSVLSRIQDQTSRNSVYSDEEDVPPLPPPLPISLAASASVERKGKKK